MTPGEDNRLLDYLADTINPTPDELTFEKALTETVEEALAGLKERESEDPPVVFRARRGGADDARADRVPHGHYARAGPADQGEGALATPARQPGARAGVVSRLTRATNELVRRDHRR